MNISCLSKYNNIPFQKQLEAKCAVINGKKPYPCYIYKLDNNDNYAKKLLADKNWEHNEFVRTMKLEDDFEGSISYYAIEDNDENCLGWCRTTDTKRAFFGDIRTLEYIEVLPKNCKYDNKHSKIKREIKRTGETLLSFLIKKAKEEGMDYFMIESPVSNAIHFYEKCGFEYGRKLKLSDEASKIAINKNEQKTKTKIELVC